MESHLTGVDGGGMGKAIFMFESVELSAARMPERAREKIRESGMMKVGDEAPMKNDVATIAFLLFGSREIANEKSCHERIYRGFMIE